MFKNIVLLTAIVAPLHAMEVETKPIESKNPLAWTNEYKDILQNEEDVKGWLLNLQGIKKVDKNNPLYIALASNQSEHIIFINTTINTNFPHLRNHFFNNALIWAADTTNRNLVEYLLRYGATPNFCDIQGQSALTHTVITYMANLMQKNQNFFKTTRYLQFSYAIASLMLNAGAKINIRDRYNQTPLNYAQIIETSSSLRIREIYKEDFKQINICRLLLKHASKKKKALHQVKSFIAK